MGHINHAAYLTFMETARLDFYDSLGFSSRNSGQVNGIILASMNIQYHQQVSHPSDLDIGQRIVRVGSKSFDMLTSIFIKDNESPVLSGLFTLVSFNYKRNETISVPDIIRDMCREMQRIKLTIQLYEDSNNIFYDCQNNDNCFEFEITILNKKINF